MNTIWHRAAIFAAILMWTCGCGDIKGSMYDDNTRSTMRNNNSKNMAALKDRDDGTELIFAMVSDSHQNLTDLSYVVKDINKARPNFVIHLGDFTDTAYALEFDLFIDTIKDLNMPFFMTIGNHDSLGYGMKLFERHFGSDNYAFVYKGLKFIVTNNVMENKGGPAYEWIENEIAVSSVPVFLFQHIPPMNNEVFNPERLERNMKILRDPKVKAVFHGHDHHFDTHYLETKLVQEVGRTEGRHYATVRLSNGIITISACYRGRCNEKVNYNITVD